MSSCEPSVFDKNKEKSVKKLRASLNIKTDDKPLGDNDLVIHIRSGDLFSKNPNSFYVPPPLCFYIQIVHD